MLDPGVGSLTWAGTTEWLLGYPDRAVRNLEQAAARAYRLNKPFQIAVALTHGMTVHGLRGDFRQVAEIGERAVKLCTEKGIPL